MPKTKKYDFKKEQEHHNSNKTCWFNNHTSISPGSRLLNSVYIAFSCLSVASPDIYAAGIYKRLERNLYSLYAQKNQHEKT